VPQDYTLQLDLPFTSQEDLGSIVAGNQSGWSFD